MQRIRTILVTALATAALAVPTLATAADLPVKAAHDVAAVLTSAFLTTSMVERDVMETKGDKFTPAIITGLTRADQEMADAERLADHNEALDPGIRHVRANLKTIRDTGKSGKETGTLFDEINIELAALQINAHILEAVAHLNSAADALSAKRSSEVVTHLQEAGKSLETASNRGAYHIQNDIEEIQAALLDISSKVNAKAAVSPDAINERIAEVRAHLFDVGQEHD
ncbi:MAG: hypothetical protein OEW11_01005 [Nitrospirota bacterium]|nr:hypothetical protein [Nitrospirota bacterium]